MADKTTVTDNADGGLQVQTNHGKDETGALVLTTWTFSSAAEAAKQRGEFDAHLSTAQRAKFAAVADKT